MGALHVAAAAGVATAIHLALQAGEEVDSKDDKGYTALMHASWTGHEGAIQVLLTAGAQVD